MARAATRAICRASSGSLQNVQAATRPSGPSTAYSVPRTGHRTDQAVSAGAFCASDSTAAPSATAAPGCPPARGTPCRPASASRRRTAVGARRSADPTRRHHAPRPTRCGPVCSTRWSSALRRRRPPGRGMDAGHPRRAEVGREVAGAPKDVRLGPVCADDLPAPHVFQKQGIACRFRAKKRLRQAARRVQPVSSGLAKPQEHRRMLSHSFPCRVCRCACAFRASRLAAASSPSGLTSVSPGPREIRWRRGFRVALRHSRPRLDVLRRLAISRQKAVSGAAL